MYFFRFPTEASVIYNHQIGEVAYLHAEAN